MSNLLEKASIVTTPTAYDNGKILSVKPTGGIGDFDFTRNSSATRVNSQGLIEDVQILSSNLVSNGDFSQEGSELITNGDFATDSDWILSGQNLSISNGQGISTGSNFGAQFKQIILQNNKFYKLTFDIVNYSSGSIGLTANYYGEAAQYNSVGTHTAYFTSLSQTEFRLYSQNFIGSIDNVSVKEVGQDWTFGTGWSIEDGKAYFDNPTGTELYQSLSTTAGKYRISFDLDITSGTIQTSFSSPSTSTIQSFTTSGTKTVDITTTASFSRFRFVGLGASVFNIDNISVIEITDDTNLPRIDYTGGVGHWLFEPQSTNKVTYSEDFSQWGFVGSANQTPNYSTSPSNLNDATMLNVTSGYIRLAITGKTSSSNQSIFVKRGGTNPATHIRLTSNNTSSWNTGSSLKYELTEDWTRINVQDGILTSSSFIIIGSVDETNTMDTDCNGTSLIWGAQVEDKSFATSYIPTEGSIKTRLQDAAFGAGSSDLINSTEGVLYAEIATLEAAAGTQVLGLSDGSGSNRIGFQTGAAANQLRFVVDSGGNQASYWHVLGDITDFNKVALKWKQDDFSFWANGVKVATDINGNVPAQNILNTLDFYYATGGGIYNFFGKTKCLAVFKEALTDEELTCLTTI